MCYNKLKIHLKAAGMARLGAFLVAVLGANYFTGCAPFQQESPERDGGKFAGYPTETVDGRKVRLIPAADYLMAQEVPVPSAPVDEGQCILISLSNKRAWHYKDGVMDFFSCVCTGKEGHETRTGRFRVVSKHREWTSTIYHVPMPFFLRLNPGDFGLHQGIIAVDSSSHGCIRLPSEKAREFFEETPTGTPVIIVP